MDKAQERPAIRKAVLEFATKLETFMNATRSLQQERNKTEDRTPQFEMVDWRYKKTIVAPMDEAWAGLTDKEREGLGEALFKLKATKTAQAQEKTAVDRVCDLFKGKAREMSGDE